MAEKQELCQICSKEAPFKCTSCKLAHYCGSDHQKEHWPKHKVDCRPFAVKQNDVLGRYMVATRDIPAKSVVFMEKPLVVGPKWCISDEEKVCSMFPCVGCFKPASLHGSRCQKCSWPVCERTCAGLNDNQMHGLECRILSTRPGPHPSSPVNVLTSFYRKDALLVLRCLLLQMKYPERWNKVMLFESHDEKRIGTKYYTEADERIVSFLVDNFWSALDQIENDRGRKIIAQRDKKLLHRICGILEVNGLMINLPAADQEVGGLFEMACILEHSCVPNCYYIFNPSQKYQITMHAGRDIRQGEHMSIMYTNMLWGTLMRQEHLLTNKYFICQCTRCLDPTELGSNLSTVKCIGDIGKYCDGVMFAKNPIDIATDWHCTRCDVSISNEQLDFILSSIENEVDELLAAFSERRITSEAMEALHDKIFRLLHGNHYHLFMLKHTLMQSYGSDAIKLQNLSDESLQRKITLCEELLSVLDCLDPNMMRLTLYIATVLLELHFANLERCRRNGNKQLLEEMQLSHSHLQRGKEALLMNTDIEAGRKLIVCFDVAEKNLQTNLTKALPDGGATN